MRASTVLAILALSGCASQWKHPTATPAQLDQDTYQCTMQAQAMYPPMAASTQLGSGGPAVGTCTGMGNQVTCVSRPGAQAPVIPYDMNAIPRNNAIRSCLYARGYTLS